MGLEVAALGEGSAAARSWTDVRPLAGMASSVDFEGVGAHEVSPTDRADVGSKSWRGLVPFIGVPTSVVFQVSQCRKTLTAPFILAQIGLLPRMDAQVSVQVPLLCKRFSAHRIRAHERPLPRLRLRHGLIRGSSHEF